MKNEQVFSRLTDAERNVMTILWSVNQPMTSVQIRDKSVEMDMEIGSYLFKVINSLLEKKMIKGVGYVKLCKKPTRLLMPCYSKQEYSAYFLESFHDNSLSHFLSGIAEVKADQNEVIDEVKEWLAAYEKSEKR